METIRRRSVDPIYSMCVQPSFIIGTNNEDGTDNFAPITWVSVTHEKDDGYLLVISMSGTKMTKRNVLRTGIFSANLVSTEMLPLMDYFGSHHAADGKKDGLEYAVSRGQVLDVPVLDQSRWVYECEVSKKLDTGDSTTFFCYIRNIQMDENIPHVHRTGPRAVMMASRPEKKQIPRLHGKGFVVLGDRLFTAENIQ